MSLPHSLLQPTASCMGRLTWPAARWGAISPATKPSRWSACAVRPTESTRRKAVADGALPRNDDESCPRTLGSHAFHRAAGLRSGPGADRHRKGWTRVDRGLPADGLGIGRALDRKFHTTLDDRTERNVGDGETIERKPIALGDVIIEYLEVRDQVGRLPGKIGSPLRGLSSRQAGSAAAHEWDSYEPGAGI